MERQLTLRVFAGALELDADELLVAGVPGIVPGAIQYTSTAASSKAEYSARVAGICGCYGDR